MKSSGHTAEFHVIIEIYTPLNAAEPTERIHGAISPRKFTHAKIQNIRSAKLSKFLIFVIAQTNS